MVRQGARCGLRSAIEGPLRDIALAKKTQPDTWGLGVGLVGVMRIRPQQAGLTATARDGGSHRHMLKTIIALTVAAVLTLAACGEANEGSDAAVTSEAQSASITSTVAQDGAGTTAADATTTSEPAGAESPGTTGSGTERRAEVIVDLAVAWNPEDGLSDEEMADIAEAQQEVLRLLEGTSFRVIRLYEITPQMALAVDDEGLKRLETSDLVAQIAPNTLDPATG